MRRPPIQQRTPVATGVGPSSVDTLSKCDSKNSRLAHILHDENAGDSLRACARMGYKKHGVRIIARTRTKDHDAKPRDGTLPEHVAGDCSSLDLSPAIPLGEGWILASPICSHEPPADGYDRGSQRVPHLPRGTAPLAREQLNSLPLTQSILLHLFVRTLGAAIEPGENLPTLSSSKGCEINAGSCQSSRPWLL